MENACFVGTVFWAVMAMFGNWMEGVDVPHCEQTK